MASVKEQRVKAWVFAAAHVTRASEDSEELGDGVHSEVHKETGWEAGFPLCEVCFIKPYRMVSE